MKQPNDYLTPVLTKDLREGDIIIRIKENSLESLVLLGNPKYIGSEAWLAPVSRESGEYDVLFHKDTWAVDDPRVPILFSLRSNVGTNSQ